MATPSATLNDGPITTDHALRTTDGTDTLSPLLQSTRDTPGSQITTFTLTNDNPNKTKFNNDSGVTLYDISPDFTGKRTMTYMKHVVDGTVGDVFGYIEWHDAFPDKISFAGSSPVWIHSFFDGGGPLKFSTTFKDEKGRKYTWKGVGSGLQMALHAADSPNPKLPIAQFQKTRYDRSTNPPTYYPAQLFLTARAKEIQDLVVFTFLVLEKKRRSKEVSEGSRADALKNSGGLAIGGSKAGIGEGV